MKLNKGYDAIKQMLKEDFGITAPVKVLKNVYSEKRITSLNKDYNFATWKKSDGFDTWDREVLVDELCSFFKIPQFPVNGDSQKVKTEFLKEFKEKVLPSGIKANWNFP